MIMLETAEDCLKEAGLGKAFFEQTGIPGDFNATNFASIWEKILVDGHGMILKRLNPKGDIAEALGVIFTPCMFTGLLSAQLAFWYVLDVPQGLESGLLWKQLEMELRTIGVRRLFVNVPMGDRFKAYSQFVSKAGLKPVELIYYKDY